MPVGVVLGIGLAVALVALLARSAPPLRHHPAAVALDQLRRERLRQHLHLVANIGTRPGQPPRGSVAAAVGHRQAPDPPP